MDDLGIAALLFFMFIVVPALTVYFLILPVRKSVKREREARIQEERKRQARMSSLCPSLTSLSSVIVKCPKCQYTFLRTDTADAQWQNAAKLRELYPDGLEPLGVSKTGGQLKATLNPRSIEAFAKALAETDGRVVYPSSFNCPRCSYLITRSREPSATCKKRNIRVTGIKLLGCTLGKCYQDD
jgi:hypothetical protein